MSLDSPLAPPKSFQPHLTFLQIVNMSFGFFGIQFGFALQNANTSYIFSALGAKPDELPILWLAAPVTGLLVQPIIGYLSDRTWNPRWGRRRPYFTVGAILASISLFLMPNSSTLWMAAGVLWIMDASINISMEPFRAFVGDMLPPSQRTRGFSTQTFFIGTGAVIASSLPWLFIHFGVNTTSTSAITDSVKYSFYIGGAVLLLSVLYTVFTTKEYPPTATHDDRVRERENEDEQVIKTSTQRFQYVGISLLSIGILGGTGIYMGELVKDLYVIAGGFVVFGIIHLVAALLNSSGRHDSMIVNMVRDFNQMPETMKRLALVQFFSWFALFAMWIFTTSAVTSHIFNTTDATSARYAEGAALVGILFAMYNGVAAIAAMFLPSIAKYIGVQATHLFALTCGGLGLISFYFVPEASWLWVSMTGVGIAWASILSIPYALLSVSLPASKMGYYMGVFNFFVVIPQIIAAASLGPILRSFMGGEPIFALVLAGCCLILGGLLTLRVGKS